jgi:predicted solute-binding protein/2-iminoacetate synthase ThiH
MKLLGTPKIRLANSAHMTAVPFNLLRGLDFVEYQENLIAENARKLHEREVDLALIPSTEFAVHGGYRGLDYGVVCHKRSDLVMLYAKQDLKKVQTVYYHEKCGSTPLLLKLLLKERWKVFPRLIKANQTIEPEDLGQNEAVLIIHEQHVDHSKITVPVAEDLIKLWYDWVGLPFVFLIWSLRPGLVSPEQYSKFHEVFTVCNQVREIELTQLSKVYDLPFGYLSKYEPDRDFYYQLGEPELKGLRTFFELCSAAGLLPETTYHSAKLGLMSRREIVQPRPVSSDILTYAVDAKRVSISDALLLAETAPLSELGLVADALRSRLYSDCSAKLGSEIMLDDEKHADSLISSLSDLAGAGFSRLEIGIASEKVKNMSTLGELITKLKTVPALELQMFNISALNYFAQTKKKKFSELCAFLATAELDLISSDDAGLLVQRQLETDANPDCLSSEQWTAYMQLAHRYGLVSELQIDLSLGFSWEDYILHLQKIRFLQDLTGKVPAFVINLGSSCLAAQRLEHVMRATALARIFLDNITTIRIRSNLELLGIAGSLLSFGANNLYIVSRHGVESPQWKLEDFLKAMEVGGLRLSVGM